MAEEERHDKKKEYDGATNNAEHIANKKRKTIAIIFTEKIKNRITKLWQHKRIKDLPDTLTTAFINALANAIVGGLLIWFLYFIKKDVVSKVVSDYTTFQQGILKHLTHETGNDSLKLRKTKQVNPEMEPLHKSINK